MNRFVIAEPSKCIGCRTCEIACALAHPIGDGTAQALSPENFKPRLKLVKSLKSTAPVQCRHCVNAPCVNACPTNAIVYRNNSVQVIQELCIGCQTCVLACPFGAMEVILMPTKQSDLGTLNTKAFLPQAHKCDLCVDVPSGPACILVCPTDALHLIEAPNLGAMSQQRRENAVAAASTTLSMK